MQGIKFRRQHPLGSFFVDFVCLEKKLVVELDGCQHRNSNADEIRDAWLKKEGYAVLRFWDNEVFENIDGVMEKIINMCK